MIPSDQPIMGQDPAEPEHDAQTFPGPATDQPKLFVVLEDGTAHPDDTTSDVPKDGLDRLLAFEGQPSPVYLISLLLGSVLLVLAASIGLFPWVASAIAVVSFAATMFRGGRWLALAGAGVVIVVVAVSVWPQAPTLADVRTAGVEASVTQDTSPTDIPAGSLGFRLTELTDLWNGLDEPPMIRRGFVRNLERGPLDSFVHQFDEGASLAGAYDPSTDYVYALVATSRIDHEAASNMYLHLCFMLHPYSQECIDAYWNEGLDGLSIEDYRAVRRSAQWEIEGQTWRLTISGNIQEIRVLGDVPG